MKGSRCFALALLFAACTYEVRPPQPPFDPQERHRAEVAACSQGTLPAWLDDAALGSAIRADRRESQASVANDSFHGATYSTQPPATGGSSQRASAMLDDRRAFEQWCAGIRAGGNGLVKP